MIEADALSKRFDDGDTRLPTVLESIEGHALYVYCSLSEEAIVRVELLEYLVRHQ